MRSTRLKGGRRRHCRLLLRVALAELAASEFAVWLLIRPWIHAAASWNGLFFCWAGAVFPSKLRAVKEVNDDEEETEVS